MNVEENRCFLSEPERDNIELKNGQKLPNQIEELFDKIKKNFWGCDLVLCLFIAALQSYRADRCLRPFPPFYLSDNEKNFTTLRFICDTIPPLNSIIHKNYCSSDVLKLLFWLFVEKGQPVLKRVNFNSMPIYGNFRKLFKPHFVFEVCYDHKFEQNWQKRKSGRDVLFAYHGSAIDNFYSILKVGLQQHFSFDKELLYGNGIYLSDDIVVSAHYSPFGQTWKNSFVGPKQSIIAVCEVINDVEKVRCKDSTYKNRSHNKDSLSGEIPEKYFVVTDSDMVRVKYLLVYRENKKKSILSYISSNNFLLFCILAALCYFFLMFAMNFMKKII